MRWPMALLFAALGVVLLACQASATPLVLIGCAAAVLFVVLPAAVLHRWLVLRVWACCFPVDTPSAARLRAERLLFQHTLALALISALVWSRVGFFSLQGMLLLDAAIGIAITVWLTWQVAQDVNADTVSTRRASVCASIATALVPLTLGLSCWTAIPALAGGVFAAAHYVNTHFSLEGNALATDSNIDS